MKDIEGSTNVLQDTINSEKRDKKILKFEIVTLPVRKHITLIHIYFS